MRSTRVRALAVALIVAGGSAVVALQSPADAAISATHITTPVTGAHYTVTSQSPPAGVTVSGTTNGTTGDTVDIRCYFQNNRWKDGPTGVPVAADGSFTTSLATAGLGYGRCRLRAVPTGIADGTDVSAYTGPVIVSEYRYGLKVASGPNAGKTYDYYVAYEGRYALNDYTSANDGGLWDSRLNFSDGSSSNYLWYSEASLWPNENNANLRSAIQVDGRNAYGPYGAHGMFPNNPGLPSLSWSTSRSPAGTTTIRETDPLVVCPSATFPATSASCPHFSSAGVRLERSIVTTDGGLRVLVTDVFRSTNGHAHTVSAHYSQSIEGSDYTDPGSTPTPVSFRTGWAGGYQTYSGATSYAGTSHVPNTLFVRDSDTAAQGDGLLPRGAITFDFPVSGVSRPNRTQANLLTALTVPAHGTRIVKQAFALGASDSGVASMVRSDLVRLNLYRSDAVVAHRGGAWIGNDVYSASGAGETSTSGVRRGRTTTFLVTVQNDGIRSTGFRVRGGGGRGAFAVKYLKGASGRTSITSDVVHGRYLTGTLAPGQSRVFRLVVTVKHRAALGALRSWLVRATSTSDGSSVDSVRARVRVRH
ncbi:MAG: hypothetical protein ACJ72E_00595 [Marmoricola sp.]